MKINWIINDLFKIIKGEKNGDRVTYTYHGDGVIIFSKHNKIQDCKIFLGMRMDLERVVFNAYDGNAFSILTSRTGGLIN